MANTKKKSKTKDELKNEFKLESETKSSCETTVRCEPTEEKPQSDDSSNVKKIKRHKDINEKWFS